MLLNHSKFTVNLKKQYRKIFHIAHGYQDTFVFLASTVQDDVFVHCDAKGNILFQKSFDKYVDSFVMCSTWQVLCLNTYQNKIFYYDLQKKLVKQFNHDFLWELNEQSQIDFFDDSNLIAIVEHGLSGDHRMTITYYHKDQFTNKQGGQLKCQNVFKASGENQNWTSEMTIRKGNRHSMYIWWDPSDKYAKIHIASLQKQKIKENLFILLLIIRTINHNLNKHDSQMEIRQIWQLKPGKLAVIIRYKDTQNQQQSAFYSIDMRNRNIHKLGYNMEQKFFNQPLACNHIGDFVVIKPYHYHHGDPTSCKISVMNSFTEQVLKDVLTWTCSHTIHHWTTPYLINTLQTTEYQPQKVRKFEMNLTTYATYNEVTLRMLDHINSDFDQDLINDVIDLVKVTQN